MSVAPSSAATLVSVSSGVENDLRSLVAEGKKKVTDLQASAERAIQKLRLIAQQAPTASPPSTPKGGATAAPAADSPAETLQSDLILRPLLLVTSAKQPKLTLLALSALQKLLTLSPLHPRFISTIVGTLRIQAETDDAAVQLKILQTLLLCISPVSIACGEILTGSLLQALGVCFRLFSSKNAMIANTSSAALRQIIQLLYDKIQSDAVEQDAAVTAEKRAEIRRLSEQSGEEMKSSNTAVVVTADEDFALADLPAEQLNGFLLYRDLCILANASEQGRTQARWLTLSSTVSPSLCIELLEGIVSGHKRLFGIEPTLFTLLKRDTCVLISRLLRSTFDFPLLVRLLRCVSLLVRHCHTRLRSECEVFMTLLIKMLGQEFPMWQHVLVLEALVGFTQSAGLVYFLFSRYDDANSNSIIASICRSLSSFILSSQLPPDASGVLGYKLSGGKKQPKALECLNEEEPPTWDEVYRVSLSIENIIAIVSGLANLAALSESDAAAVTVMRGSSTLSEKSEEKSKAAFDSVSSPPPLMSPTAASSASAASAFAPDDDDLSPDREVLKRLVLSCWQSILAALSSLLAKTSEEAQVQHLLMAYQSFTNTCGMLQLVKPRDALLSSLCSFALKKQFPRDESIQELMKSVLTTGTDGQLAPLLTAKNIQAYKALFNIAHCLGSYLGSAWSVVLETFHQLDTVIQLTQEIQARMMRGGGESKDEYTKILPNANEIIIMSTALARLFESTRYLDDAAVTQVLSALGALSLTTLAAAGDVSSTASSGGRADAVGAGAASSMRIFSLANLIATIEHNMFRISSAKLWSLGINHLTCVITHRDARIRAYGVEALRKLTILALGKKPAGPPVRDAKPTVAVAVQEEKAAAAADIFDDPDAFQLSLLSPLTELYIKSRYDDTRLQLLQALHSILQAAGQSMSAGWTTILEWLSQVCEIGGVPGSPRGADSAVATGGKGDAGGASKEKAVVSGTALITLGFNSTQLIVNDFIDSIPLDRIPLLIATIGQYCVQRQDTNISFTSIGLLWRVSDYIARIVGVHIARRKASVADLPNGADAAAKTNGNGPSTESNVLTEAAADRLMLSLFTQLHSLSMDSRPEVRNSAVKTFSSTLVAHGARMRADACIECLQSFQLPLLTSLLEANPEREKESVGATSHELGRDKDSGRSVMMMVHHSRDTAQKQWDETRVFALQGAARVLKVYVEAWGQLQEFVALWPAYLTHCREAVGHRSQEVALAAVNALQEVMGAPSTQASFIEQPTLWSPVMPMYREAVEYGVTQAEQLQAAGKSDLTGGSTSLAALSPEAGWKHWMKLYTQLVSTWQLLVAASPRLFSDTDLTLLLDFTQKLAAFGPPVIKRKGIVDCETPLQAASLRLIEHLTPLPHQYPMLLSHLLSCLRPAADQSTLTPFTRKALSVLDVMYAGAPPAVRAEQFTLVVGVLSGALRATEGWVREESEGVDEVVNAYVHVVEVGLPAAAEAGLAGSELWTSLLDSLSSMLLPPPASTTASPPAVLPPLFLPSVPVVLPARFTGPEQQLWEHLQISLVGLLVRHVLPSSLACPLDVQWQLICLLNLGYASLQPAGAAALPPGPVPNELLSHACMMGLFALVSLSTQPESAATCYLRVGVLCVPLLLHRAQHVLAGFVADQRVLGELPQSRREEMGFVLRELHSLSVHPQVSAVLTAASQLEYVKQLQALDEVAESAPGWRRHTLTLFPALCDCVCVAELELRELLRDLLHQAAGEMGLEKHRAARKQSAAVREAVEDIVNHAKAT